MSFKKPILTYLGLIAFLFVGFFIAFFYFIYEMVTVDRRPDGIILIFTLLCGATTTFLGYKLLQAEA